MNPIVFGAPWFLWGGTALLIPFLLLLTRARTRKVIAFSSIEFLSALTQRSSQAIEWKRLLLLFVRLIILAALTLGFSLPYFSKQKGWTFLLPPSYDVYLVDNSWSMAYEENGKSLLDRAKAAIEIHIRSEQGPGTLFSLYVVNSQVQEIEGETSDREKWLNALSQVTVSSRASRFEILKEEIHKIAESHGRHSGNIFVYSDFSFEDLEIRNELSKLFEAGVGKIRVTPKLIQPKTYRNFTIESVELPPVPFLPGEEESVLIHYKNYGFHSGERVRICALLGESEIGSAYAVISDKAENAAVLRARFPSSGDFSIRIESEKDALAMDNVRYTGVHVHEPVKVLLVESQTYSLPFKNPNFYFSHVLQSQSETASKSWLSVSDVQLSDLASIQMENYDWLVMADVPMIQPAVVTHLKTFLSKGGTVFFSAGSSFDTVPASSADGLTKLLGGYFGEPVGAGAGKSFFIAPWEEEPFLKIFEGGRQGDFSKIRFHTFLPFMISDEQATFKTLLWLDKDFPLLLQRKEGSGNLFIWTSSLNTDWNDFPKHSIYVPFMLELIQYSVFGSSFAVPEVRPGDKLPFQTGSRKFFDQLTLRDPRGEQITFYQSEAATLSYPAEYPGIYEWILSSEGRILRGEAVCNIDTAESEPHYWKVPEALSVTSETQPGSGTFESQGKFEQPVYIYTPFFIGVFFLLLVEALLANRFYRTGRI